MYRTIPDIRIQRIDRWTGNMVWAYLTPDLMDELAERDLAIARQLMKWQSDIEEAVNKMVDSPEMKDLPETREQRQEFIRGQLYRSMDELGRQNFVKGL